jgi:hypothetical protein
MKKLISILVVFAVLASAVIAQEGSWSVGGSGEISTRFNFIAKNVDTDSDGIADPGQDPEPSVGVHAYNNYGYYGKSTGSLSLTYSNGDLSAGLSFDPSDNVYGDLKYDSGDIAFNVNVGIMDLLNQDFETAVGRLWGYYKFLDGAIHLEVAMNSRDTNYWISNEVVGNVFDGSGAPDYFKWGIGWGFMSVDHHNYLLADFNLSSLVDGLSLGFMLPGVFNYLVAGDKWKGGDENLAGWQSGSGNHPVGYGTYIPIKSAFQLLRFGVKYASGPIDAAAQFALTGPSADPDKANSALYFGLNFQINDQMKAGLGLEGTFDADNSDANKFAFGANFSYGDGPFSAGIEGGLYFADSDDKGLLGLRPKISYNLVDNYLNITLDAFLFFPLDSDIADAQGLGYEITPELSFNVAGTGAGQGYYWPNATAIILRYKVAGWSKADDAIYNAVDITFKWSF